MSKLSAILQIDWQEALAGLAGGRYRRAFADCIILTAANEILLQQRPPNYGIFSDCLTAFGGQIETGENPERAIVRELTEELGMQVLPAALLALGAVTESETKHADVVFSFFHRETVNTITGCYEHEPRYYPNVASVLAHPKLTGALRWGLSECQQKQLLSP